MGYNMKRGNSAVPFKELGSSPAKAGPETKQVDVDDLERQRREDKITKEHNITEEKFNPTGNTCMVCGYQKDEHKNKDHAFKTK